MAIFRWRGTSSGAWETPGNWVNESGTVYASGYPGAGNDYEDDVYLDAAATTALAGYDATAKGVLRSFKVSDAYDKAIGSSDTKLEIKCQEVQIEGGDSLGAVYLEGVTSGGWTDGITKVTVLAGDDIELYGTIQTLVLLKGEVTIGASATIGTALTVGYTTSTTADSTLTIPSTATLPSTINVFGGTTTCSKAVTTLNLTTGAWTQSAGDITTLTQQSGTMNWNAGNITTLTQYGGTFTAAGGSGPRRIGTVYVYPNAICTLDNGQDNIQVTSFVRRYGGTITFSAGYDIAPYATTTYAGASDDCLGIPPQTINNSNVDGDSIYLSVYDRLDVYCVTGAIAAGGAVTFKAQEAATSGGAYSDVSGKTAAFDDGDDNQTKIITIWGYELTAGKPWVKINVAESGTQDALVSCVYVKSTF